MLIMKYQNKLIYTDFTYKDFRNVIHMTPNVNKIEIIMNNTGGSVFDQEICNIKDLYDYVKRYFHGVRIILYTMNNRLHRLVKIALYGKGIIEDGILRMNGGEYHLYDNHHKHHFYKNKWNIVYTKETKNKGLVTTKFSEYLFEEEAISLFYIDRIMQMKKFNPILHKIVLKRRLEAYPITEYAILCRICKEIYDEYIKELLKNSNDFMSVMQQAKEKLGRNEKEWLNCLYQQS